MLKHHRNAQLARLLGVPDVHTLAIKQHVPFIRLGGTVNDLHQRRFASTVFAKNGMGLTWLNTQADAIVGHHRRITFGDAHQLQTR